MSASSPGPSISVVGDKGGTELTTLGPELLDALAQVPRITNNL
ncbi:MAG: hypothetical protein NTX42_07830 [Methanothrix sp.]|nr:hypothetical protein [Methanothrix sp.]